MENNKNSIYCDCGECLAEKDTITGKVKLDDGIKYTIEDKELKVPSIVCKCNCCGTINYIRGNL